MAYYGGSRTEENIKDLTGQMIRKFISDTGISVSGYCLGTMYFGTKVDESRSFRLMDIYAESGGNFLDSANKYASWIPGFIGGESETVVGKWLKDRRRDDFILVSKVGFAYGDVPRTLSAEVIVAECEKSLRRLGTDYIDVYFAHSQDNMTPLEESMEAFDSLVRSGKVRCIGASNHDLIRLYESNETAKRSGYARFSVLQQRHSLLQPYVGADFGTQKILTPEQREYCRSNGYMMMAYSPLLGGAFNTGELPVQYDCLHNRKVLSVIQRYAEESGYSVSQLVLSGLLYSQDIIPIVAASTEDHLSESLALPDSEVVMGMMDEISSIDVQTIRY